MAGVAGMGTPKSLTPPVPNEAPQIDMSNVAQIPNFATQPAPAQSQKPDLDSLFDETMGASGASDLDSIFNETMGSGEATLAEETEASMAEEGPGVVEQFGNIMQDTMNPIGSLINLATGKPLKSQAMLEDAGARLKASFGKTDKEKRFVLDKSYGAENVKKAKDGFLIKKDGKWRKFDKDNFELINDVLDFGGDIVEQGITEAATAGGLALATGETAAAPLTGGASLLAVPGTVALARGAGAVAGTGARDLIAQQVLGIPRDEERSAVTEYGTNAALNMIGGRVAQWAEGKLAARAAARADEILQAPEELLEKEISLTREASQVLKDSGLYHEELSLLEQIPSSAEAAEVFDKIAKDPYTREVLTTKNMAFENANRKFLDSVAKFSGNISGKINKVGQRVGDYIGEARKAEGKLIGDYRKQFLDQAGSGELPVPQLQSKIDEIAGNLGFQVKDNQLIKPSTEQLEELGYSKEGAENLSRLVDKLNQKLFNQEGRVSGKELNALYEQWSNLTSNLYSRGEGADKAYRKTVTEIKDAIRDAYTEKIGVVLDGNEGYKKALGEFSFIEKNRKQIEDILDKDKISSMAFAKHIFSKGADGLDDLRAVKAVLKNRPELISELNGQFYADLVRNNTDPGTGKVAWTKVHREISKFGPEMLEEIMGKDSMKRFDALQTVGANLERVSKMGGLKGPEQASIVKNLSVAVAEGSGFGYGNGIIQSLTQLDKEKAIFTALKQEGIDSFLRTAPKSQKPLLKRVLQGYLDAQDKALKSPIAQAYVRGAAARAARPKEKEN